VNPQLSAWLPTLIAVPLVGFMLYRRLRRTFGRQPVTPKRMVSRMALLCVVCILLLVRSSATAVSLGAAVAGLVLGATLAVVGLMHTKVESTAEGKFYTPNKWIGLAVTALVLGRLAGRLVTVSGHATQVASETSPFAGLQRSPLTLGLFFLLAGYYVTYYAGVLRKAAALGAPFTASRLS
jgi:H+/gluconate symporter-like permease